MFGVNNEGPAKAGKDTRNRRENSPKRTGLPPSRGGGPPPPSAAPVAKHEYPNWEDAFSHRDFAFASESDDGNNRRDCDSNRDWNRDSRRARSRSASPIRRDEKMQPASMIDQYADAFEQFERGK